MRYRPALAAAVLLTAISATSACTSAQAGEQPSFSATPDPAKPGDSVVLSVSGGCEGPAAVASSDVFTQKVTLSKGTSQAWNGTATIRRDVSAGSHQVKVSCEGGGEWRYRLNVAGSVTPSPHPTRGSHAGTGGTQDGPGFGSVAAGAGLVAGVLGFTWLQVRRPREE